MNSRTVILILIVILASAGVYYFIKKKQTPGKDPFQSIKKLFEGSDKVAKEKPLSSDKQFLREQGFSDVVLNMLSVNDAADAVYYIISYLRKGIPLDPKSPLFDRITRIAKYSGMFPVPSGIKQQEDKPHE